MEVSIIRQGLQMAGFGWRERAENVHGMIRKYLVVQGEPQRPEALPRDPLV